MAKRISVSVRILDVQDQGCHILIDGKLNGIPICLVVDTGASRTVFDKDFLDAHLEEDQMIVSEEKSAGLGSTEMDSFFAEVEKLSFGRLKMEDLTLVGIDLENIRLSYQMLGLPEIHGVLGGDILSYYSVVIDYGRSKLMFRIPEEATE